MLSNELIWIFFSLDYPLSSTKKERKRKKNPPLNQKINISFYIQIPYYTAIGRFISVPPKNYYWIYFGVLFFSFDGKGPGNINQPSGLF
jgi:hypothetical protein